LPNEPARELRHLRGLLACSVGVAVSMVHVADMRVRMHKRVVMVLV
jgi:hypothetical protein